MKDFLTNNIPYICSQIGTIGELTVMSECKDKPTVTYKTDTNIRSLNL